MNMENDLFHILMTLLAIVVPLALAWLIIRWGDFSSGRNRSAQANRSKNKR